MVGGVRKTGKSDNGFVRRYEPPHDPYSPPSEAQLERRAEFVRKVTMRVYRQGNSTTHPHKTKMESVELPGWYEWEVALVREMVEVLSVIEIYESFFEGGTSGPFTRRSFEDVERLVRLAGEE